MNKISFWASLYWGVNINLLLKALVETEFESDGESMNRKQTHFVSLFQ